MRNHPLRSTRSLPWRPATLLLATGLAASGAHAAVGCRAPTPAEAAFYTTPMMMPGITSPKDGTCYVNNLKITAADGVQLSVNALLPAGYDSGKKFPGVLFISSWASADWFEYLGAQHRFAQQGYVTVAYTARGFWNSGGTIDTAGPKDVGDVSSAIDWMIANTPADSGKIGSTGISYGAGLSLMGSAKDGRIKAVSAMSGWANLVDQLYGNQVPNQTWIRVLDTLGKVTGRPSAEATQSSALLMNPDTTAEQVAALTPWGLARSPITYVDQINSRGTPTLISKNWQDDMFSPNPSFDLFAKLTVPKKLIMQPGIHGSAEIPGAVFGTTPNRAYDATLRWFDRYLKGIQNGVDTEPKVTFVNKFGGGVDNLSNLPAPELRKMTFQMGPRGDIRWDWNCFCMLGDKGTLTAGAPAAGTDTINNALDTTATTGLIPVLTVTTETLGLPVTNAQGTILRGQGLRFESAALPNGLKIRGIPAMKLTVKPSQQRGMLVAYLYAVDAFGTGTLITHGARAVHWATPGQTIDFSFNLNAISYDVPAGHKLALVFDTQDSVYGNPVKSGETFSMSVLSGAQLSSITLPVR